MPYEQMFPQHINIMKQILNNNHHKSNSNSHDKALGSMHQTEKKIVQQIQPKTYNLQQQPNQTSFVEGEDNYLDRVTYFFLLNY